MKKPNLSIIIPTFNEEKYIKNTLLSIKNQDYKGTYEIIVVDGNSRDNTVKIAKANANKIIIIRKRRTSVSRNTGAKHASSNILIFLDADTILSHNVISEVAKVFKDKKIIGVTCKLIPDTKDLAIRSLFALYNFISNITIKIGKSHIAGAFCAYRKKEFNIVKGFNANLDMSDDVELSIKINKLGKIKYLKNIFAITSARRIKSWGIINSFIRYVILFMYFYLTGNILQLKQYKPIR